MDKWKRAALLMRREVIDGDGNLGVTVGLPLELDAGKVAMHVVDPANGRVILWLVDSLRPSVEVSGCHDLAKLAALENEAAGLDLFRKKGGRE